MADVVDVNAVEPQVTEPVAPVAPEGESLLTGDTGEAVAPAGESLLTGEEAPAEPAQEAVVPEAYEIAPGEGYEVTPEIMEVVSPLFKKYNLTQEGAQELANAHMDIMKKQSEAAEKFRTDMIQGWVKEIKNDPEFGGSKFNENMAMARRGLRAISPSGEGKTALTELLEASGMGNHPEIIKAFARVGRMVKEDSVLDKGTVASDKSADPIAEAFAKSLASLEPKRD